MCVCRGVDMCWGRVAHVCACGGQRSMSSSLPLHLIYSSEIVFAFLVAHLLGKTSNSASSLALGLQECTTIPGFLGMCLGPKLRA